jgi:hypothetical protein
MIWIKLITILLAGALNSLGGFHWLFCRRFIMPFILGVSVSVICHTWWLGITVLPVMGTLCMGYFGTGNAGASVMAIPSSGGHRIRCYDYRTLSLVLLFVLHC